MQSLHLNCLSKSTNVNSFREYSISGYYHGFHSKQYINCPASTGHTLYVTEVNTCVFKYVSLRFCLYIAAVIQAICSQRIHELLFGKRDGPKYCLSEPSSLTMWWDLPSQNPSWVKPEYAEAFFLLLFPLLRSPLKQPSLQVSNLFPLFHFFSSFKFLLFLLSSAKYSSCSLGFNLLKYLGCYFWLGGVNTLSVLPALKGKMILECWIHMGLEDLSLEILAKSKQGRGHGKTRTRTWNHVVCNSFGTWGF